MMIFGEAMTFVWFILKRMCFICFWIWGLFGDLFRHQNRFTVIDKSRFYDVFDFFFDFIIDVVDLKMQRTLETPGNCHPGRPGWWQLPTCHFFFMALGWWYPCCLCFPKLFHVFRCSMKNRLQRQKKRSFVKKSKFRSNTINFRCLKNPYMTSGSK